MKTNGIDCCGQTYRLLAPGRYSDHQDSCPKLACVICCPMAWCLRLCTLRSRNIWYPSRWLAIAKLIVNSVGSFQQRQVHIYLCEAVLSGFVITGVIFHLILWADLKIAPIRKSIGSAVNFQLDLQAAIARDVTGLVGVYAVNRRTHQLRVHAADVRGFGIPILGDRLYDAVQLQFGYICTQVESCFEHPQSDKLSIYEQRRHF